MAFLCLHLRLSTIRSIAAQYLCFRKDRLKTSRWSRDAALLVAIDSAIRIHIAARTNSVTAIAAAHVAIRSDEAVETGGNTVHAARLHSAANITKYLLDMVFFYSPVIIIETM